MSSFRCFCHQSVGNSKTCKAIKHTCICKVADDTSDCLNTSDYQDHFCVCRDKKPEKCRMLKTSKLHECTCDLYPGECLATFCKCVCKTSPEYCRCDNDFESHKCCCVEQSPAICRLNSFNESHNCSCRQSYIKSIQCLSTEEHECICKLTETSHRDCMDSHHECICSMSPDSHKNCLSETHKCLCDAHFTINQNDMLKCRLVVQREYNWSSQCHSNHNCTCLKFLITCCRIHTNSRNKSEKEYNFNLRDIQLNRQITCVHHLFIKKIREYEPELVRHVNKNN